MSLNFSTAIDAVAVADVTGSSAAASSSPPLVAVGATEFNGRMWTGALHIFSADQVRTSAPQGVVSEARRGGVCALAWLPSQSPQEALLLAGGDQGLIELQQVELGSAKDSSISISMLGTSVAHSAGITDITTCGGTNHAASCSSDGMIASWDIVAGVQPASRFTSHQGPVNSIACSPSSSTTLASCGQDGGVSLWDLRSNQRSSSSSLDAPGCSICWVDDAAVVVGDALGRLQLIDTRQMQAVSVVRQHQDVIMGLQYSKAAGQVLTASDDGSARTAAIKGGVLVPAASAVCAASSSFMRAAAWMSASEVLLSNWDGLLWCSQLQPAASP